MATPTSVDDETAPLPDAFCAAPEKLRKQLKAALKPRK